MIPRDWSKVESSTIHQMKFEQNKHDDRGDIHVEFKSGRTYKYKDVPGVHAEKMFHASSPGTYHKTHISGNYEVEKVQ